MLARANELLANMTGAGAMKGLVWLVGQSLGGGRRYVRRTKKEEHFGPEEAKVSARKPHGKGVGRGPLRVPVAPKKVPKHGYCLSTL